MGHHFSFQHGVLCGNGWVFCGRFTLAQFERLDTFVTWRKKMVEALATVVADCPWLTPQHTPEYCEHSCWAYVVRLEPDHGTPEWGAFYDKFIELGGDGFYGAWSLTYLEPTFQDGSVFQDKRYVRPYPAGTCPVAENIQPRLIQFKTNDGDQATIDRQCEALAATIAHFS